MVVVPEPPLWPEPPTEVEPAPPPPPPPPELGAGSEGAGEETGADGSLGAVVEVSGAVAEVAEVADGLGLAGADPTAAGWLRWRRLCRWCGVRLRPVTPGTNWAASSALVVVVGAGMEATVGRAALTVVAVVGTGVPAVAW